MDDKLYCHVGLTNNFLSFYTQRKNAEELQFMQTYAQWLVG